MHLFRPTKGVTANRPLSAISIENSAPSLVRACWTDEQKHKDNPCRSRSKTYLHPDILSEIMLGKVSLFADAESLFDLRQTK